MKVAIELDEARFKDIQRIAEVQTERRFQTAEQIIAKGAPVKQEPSNDAISRRAVLEYIEESEAELGHSSENELVCQYIKNLPSVTPQPKTGRWIYGIDEDTGEKDIYAWTCSECEGKYPWQPKYCPSCGAKMESKEP